MVSLLFVLAAALAGPLAHADPLLDRMSGSWVGEGERVQMLSGRMTAIRSQTDATLQSHTLYSHNVITETEAQVGTKTYVRDYWVRAASRPSLDARSHYELGAGEQVGSHGRFDGEVFEVEQVLGDYRVHSRTRFDAQGSLYEASDWFGDRELSRTRIRYHR